MKKFALISLSMLLLGGCATMEQALSPEVRYGQLYALQDALTTAGHKCGDREATFTATYWASTTVGNIDEHSRFLKADSAQQQKSKELVEQLYALAYHGGDSAIQCKQIVLAGNTTRELLVLLQLADS